MNKPYKITKLDTPQDVYKLDNLIKLLFDNTINSGFVDRGDITSADFDHTDLTTGGAWTDLDLSGIVPVGTKAVVLEVLVKDDLTNAYLLFRKDSTTGGSQGVVRSQVADLEANAQMTISVDDDRKIQYYKRDVAFTEITVRVVGWFK